MSAPDLWTIEVRPPRRGTWQSLTEAGTLTTERHRAQTWPTRREAEHALARKRGLMPLASWRIARQRQTERLALVREDRQP